MKIFPWRLLLCPGVALLLPCQAQAKKHHHPPAPAPLATPASEPPPLPMEAAPSIHPGAPPSASLQPFLDTHLSTLLAPLGVSAFAQPELLASLKAGYADGMASAPAAHRPAYELAQNICDAMSAAVIERQNAVSALRGALATRSSEAAQPRGGGEAVENARNSDAFFLDSQKTAWLQRATALRQSITTLYLRERAVERQIGAWSPSPPAPVAAAPSAVAAATPSVSAPPPAVPDGPSQGWDPVIGQWLLAGRSPLTLAADHTISGGRSGTWTYTCTTNGGRNYEIRWHPPKYWTDYLVLSSDGKTMDGKTRENGHVSYYRQ